MPRNEEQLPRVTMDMGELGTIEMDLFPDVAPNTVASFISLIQAGFYDGLIFHRIIPGFMIQGGDPTGTGMGGPGYGIRGEFQQNGFENKVRHERGVLSMARSQNPNSAGSQFFLMVQDAPHLDGAYAAFGAVVKGMEVADAIVNTPRDASDRPLEERKIIQMTVDTFGKDYPRPEILQGS